MVILRCAFSCLNYGTRNFCGGLTMCFFVFELWDSEFLSCLNYGTQNFYGDLAMCFFVFELRDSKFLWRSYDEPLPVWLVRLSSSTEF
jgi:cytosine/uracil/thiamine/allantoin permease